MKDYYQYSVPELVRMIGERFKEYRLGARMTQQEVADQAGLSVMTIYKFENGQAKNVSLATIILLMKAIGCIDQLDNIFPELPTSPYLIKNDATKVKRIRHKKQ